MLSAAVRHPWQKLCSHLGQSNGSTGSERQAMQRNCVTRRSRSETLMMTEFVSETLKMTELASMVSMLDIFNCVRAPEKDKMLNTYK